MKKCLFFVFCIAMSPLLGDSDYKRFLEEKSYQTELEVYKCEYRLTTVRDSVNDTLRASVEEEMIVLEEILEDIEELSSLISVSPSVTLRTQRQVFGETFALLDEVFRLCQENTETLDDIQLNFESSVTIADRGSINRNIRKV